MRGRSMVGTLAVAASLGLASSALATTVLPLSLDDLAARSDVVARVRVGPVRVEATPEAPFRVTTLEVVEPLAGSYPGEALALWQRGDGRTRVVGDPLLEPGDEALVFLVRRSGRVYLTALAQAFWRLEAGPGAGVVARRDLSGLHLARGGAPVAMAPDVLDWRSLRDLVLRACAGPRR